MKNFLNKYWPILIILILSGLIVWPIFLPGYFSHHDDSQVMRIFEMRKCFKDLQIPCRWVPDMGFGNGFPLFNYYGVFPYYIGAIFSYIFGFIGAAKVLFFIPLIFGGVSMYLLAKELEGKWVGLTASVLYSFAPYRSLDTYVRGDIGESFALAIIPLVFYFGIKLARRKTKVNFILLSLSLGAFLTTHNIITMLFSPLLILFLFYIKFVEKSQNSKAIILSMLLGLGLSAFFLFPAFLEKDLVQTDNLTRFDLNFRVHFVTLNQLFLSRFWGYGASVLGPSDTISFQIGWPHWWLVIIGLFVFLKKKRVFLLSLIGIFLISIFMTHNKSAFIWEKIDILRYTQFPWRFLSLSIFSASLIGGFSLIIVRDKGQKYVAISIIFLTIFLNFSYFKPEKFNFDLTDQQKLSGTYWDEQRRAGILDYLPKGAYEPKESAPTQPHIVRGEAGIKNFINKSNSWQFDINIKKTTEMEMPVFDFPNWEVYSNGKKIPHNNDNLLKRIQFNLEEGNFEITGQLKDTAIRTVSNLLTLASLIFLVFLIYGQKFKKIK